MNNTSIVNQKLSHYHVISRLGEGGMGEVWLAEDTRLERKVVLKLLPAEFHTSPDRLRRFQQEACAASALNHPNIITIYDIGETDAGRFIVMEYVEGRTLREHMCAPCAMETLAGLGTQIAAALAVAHAAGITHRDVKPENVMVREDGWVKVLDFGLARVVPREVDHEEETLARTRPGVLLGTVKYMSPEQTRGATTSPPSDIFSLGIVLYELATGRHPFVGETLPAMLHAIDTQTPVAPARLNPEIPAALSTLILRMLSHDEALRPAAETVRATLEELSQPGDAATAPRPARAATLAPTVGRREEMAELRRCAASVMTDSGLLLCVTGEPGIGKSTLVESVLGELETGGQYIIARGKCSERLAGTEVWLPLLEALENLLRGPDGAAFARLMKQVAPTWYAQVVPLSGDEDEAAETLLEIRTASQERVKRELSNFLAEITRARPLIILFEDLHWADVSTVDMISYLAARFDVLRVLIVVTYRASDLLLSRHPFFAVKQELESRELCREIEPDFLRRDHIAEYLALEFPGHAFPAELADLIHERTEGSPLFMTGLTGYLRDRGIITGEDGVWKLKQPLDQIEEELPASIRSMIERKIDRLGVEDRQLLVTASVQGTEFDTAVLAHVLKLDPMEIEERLESLERVHGFVELLAEREMPDGALSLRYRFVHVLYQDALYASLRATRRVMLNQEVARALETLHGEQRANIASVLAGLWADGREPARAAVYYRMAASQAIQLYGPEEAVELARRGLLSLARVPEDAARHEQELLLRVVEGNALLAMRGYGAPEVERAYATAHALCQQQEDSPHFAPILYGLSVNHLVKANHPRALELAHEFLDVARSQQSPTIVVAHRLAGVALFSMGRLAEARDHFEQVQALYAPDQHQALTWLYGQEPGMTCQSYLTLLSWLQGYPDRAMAHGREAMRLGLETQHANSQGFALVYGALHHQFRRDWARVRELTEIATRQAAENGLDYWSALSAILHGWALTGEGDAAAGVAQLRTGLDAYRATGAEFCLPWFLSFLAEAYRQDQRPREALATLDEALTLVRKNDEHVFAAELHRLRGAVLLDGQAPAAGIEACFRQAIDIARAQQARSLELRATLALARLLRDQGQTTAARDTLAGIYEWFTEGFETLDLHDARQMLEEIDGRR
ncbi:MAG: serine/threonine-protein kinase PknK [Blastocatellia bacterium]